MVKRHFTIPHFVRNISIELLQAYFKQANIIYPDNLNTPKNNSQPNEQAISQYINTLDTKLQDKITQDFIEINELAYEGGIASIIDVANTFSVKIQEKFDKLESDTNKALFCFLEYQEIFERASQIAFFEGLTSKTVINGFAQYSVEQISSEEVKTELETELKIYFKQTDGRGENCKVEIIPHQDRVFYHALPQNYSEYIHSYNEKGELQRNIVKPIFNIAFIFYYKEGKFELSVNFGNKRRKQLIDIFNKVVLKSDTDIEDNKQAYDFNKILLSEFTMPIKLEDKIEFVYLKQVRLSYKYVPTKKVIIEVEDKKSGGAIAIHEMIKELRLDTEQLNVTQATFKIKFEGIGNKGSVTAMISFPDKCNLSDTPTHQKAKEYLKYWGLEINDDNGNI